MAREVIRIRDEFYIRSSSPRVDVRTRVLKQGDTFAVFDRFGDIDTFGSGELGLYYQDTRFLSRLTLKLGKDRPLLLSSTVREDNAVLAVDATNPDVWRDGEIVIPRGTVHVFRSKILWEKTCHERLRIHNYGRAAVDISLAIEFDADFADIFELRGMNRECRGRRLETQVTKDGPATGAQLHAKWMAIHETRSRLATKAPWRRRRMRSNACAPESPRFSPETNSSTIG